MVEKTIGDCLTITPLVAVAMIAGYNIVPVYGQAYTDLVRLTFPTDFLTASCS